MNFFMNTDNTDLKLIEEIKSLQSVHLKCLSVINFCEVYKKFTDIMDFFSSTGSMISKAIGFIFKLRGGN